MHLAYRLIFALIFALGLKAQALAQYVQTTPQPRDNLVAQSKASAFTKDASAPNSNYASLVGDEWLISGNGMLTTWVNIPHDVPATSNQTQNTRRGYSFKFWARADLAGPEAPKLELYVDGTYMVTLTISNSTYTNLIGGTINVKPGVRRVDVKFINDYYAPPLDSNVYIKELLVFDYSVNPDLPPEAGAFEKQSITLMTGFFGSPGNSFSFGAGPVCDTTRAGCKNIDFIKSTGANDITFTVICTLDEITSKCSSPVSPGSAEETALRAGIRYAKSKPMTVTLKSHVLVNDNVLQVSQYRPSDPVAFFAALQKHLKDLAKLAREEGVSLLVIGAEMGGLITKSDPLVNGSCASWRGLVDEVRIAAANTSRLPPSTEQIPLKLTYAATLSGYNNSLQANEAPYVCFWEKMDYIGLNAYHNSNYADVCASAEDSKYYTFPVLWKNACVASSLSPSAKIGSTWNSYLRMFFAPSNAQPGAPSYFNLDIYYPYSPLDSTSTYSTEKLFSMPISPGFEEFNISNTSTRPYENRYNSKYYSTKWYADFVIDAINSRIMALPNNPTLTPLKAILTEVGVQSSYNVHGHWGSTVSKNLSLTDIYNSLWPVYVDEQARAWDGYLRAFRKDPRIVGISIWGVRPDYSRDVPYSDRALDWLVDFDFNGKRNAVNLMPTEEVICKWFKKSWVSGTCVTL